MPEELKKTPLADWHAANGANLVDFGGWSMPLWYPSGARNEHFAVITAAGLFDTSHMAVVMVTGPDSFDLLQLCFTQDLSKCVGKSKAPLSPGRCVYGAYLEESGNLIDDTIIYQIAPELYLAVVNCGMGGPIAKHLQAQSQGRNIEVRDLTGQVGKIDLQGRESAKIIRKALQNADSALQDMPYFSFKGYFEPESEHADTLLADGAPILLSRTGYTGEFGFEIFVGIDNLVKTWETILSAGEDHGLIPCGLAARDSLRAGAGLPLSHQDIGSWPFINHPWQFALPFDAEGKSFTKKFVGDAVLDLREQADHTYAFVGNDPRKVSLDDPAVALDSDGKEVGVVLTCVADLAIGKAEGRIYSIASPDSPEGFQPRGLCCGFVKVKTKLASGDTIKLKDNRREIDVEITDDIRPDRTARRPMREFLTE